MLTTLLALPIVLFALPVSAPNGLLDPLTIPKYVNQLTRPPPVYTPQIVTDKGSIKFVYTVTVTNFSQQILPPPLPQTPVWGYGGLARDALTGKPLGFIASQPGPTFEAIRGVPIEVTWVNSLEFDHMFPVDPTLHWADPNDFGMPDPPVPSVSSRL